MIFLTFMVTGLVTLAHPPLFFLPPLMLAVYLWIRGTYD